MTAADVSPHMIERAKLTVQASNMAPELTNSVTYQVADIVDTGYEDSSFDGVVCFRLLHHFHEEQLRHSILKELSRISKGHIVISVFTSTALDYRFMNLKNHLVGKAPSKRSYVPLGKIRDEIAEAGLEIVQELPRARYISPLWLFVLKRID